jgi:uncharacterized membrane protein YgdD (TMEM256/DUF423 family)
MRQSAKRTGLDSTFDRKLARVRLCGLVGRMHFRVAAIFGFLGVALGAFGAHGLHDLLVKNGRLANWDTAVLYHLVHAVVLLTIARIEPLPRLAWWLFASGIAVFSGTLYVLAITDARWLGKITPIGGLALMVGWLMLALQRSGSRR